ncbi:CLUMA_CG011677, isoform A [Clunio marinus]|uniref:CLUMA_CG011677, isoform A n=1 Tax=Clunio marinus TaxID=568069 RepID=A0A1J1IDM1_9DIPT|nr:CLUMA_CG011677, isoform A [Clunio marinus]
MKSGNFTDIRVLVSSFAFQSLKYGIELNMLFRELLKDKFLCSFNFLWFVVYSYCESPKV